jgi:hypothetical protein
MATETLRLVDGCGNSRLFSCEPGLAYVTVFVKPSLIMDESRYEYFVASGEVDAEGRRIFRVGVASGWWPSIRPAPAEVHA